jgi:hypothetical protein
MNVLGKCYHVPSVAIDTDRSASKECFSGTNDKNYIEATKHTIHLHLAFHSALGKRKNVDHLLPELLQSVSVGSRAPGQVRSMSGLLPSL